MNYKDFRLSILNEQDNAWEEHGCTPDHIVVSKEIYNWLDEGNRLESLKDNSCPKMPGYIGMKVWCSRDLDKHGNAAILISDEVFEQIVPRVKDMPPKRF